MPRKIELTHPSVMKRDKGRRSGFSVRPKSKAASIPPRSYQRAVDWRCPVGPAARFHFLSRPSAPVATVASKLPREAASANASSAGEASHSRNDYFDRLQDGVFHANCMSLARALLPYILPLQPGDVLGRYRRHSSSRRHMKTASMVARHRKTGRNDTGNMRALPPAMSSAAIILMPVAASPSR